MLRGGGLPKPFGNEVKLKDDKMAAALTVLDYLYERQAEWTCLWDFCFEGKEDDVSDVSYAMPRNWTPRRRLALMRVLCRNGLVGGCDCGCRGDFEITDQGLELINKPRLKEYSRY